MLFLKNYFLTISILTIFACDSKPKVIVADDASKNTEVATEMSNPQAMKEGVLPSTDGGVHQVIANEILQAERYTYLNVTEGNRTFWIATSKNEAKKGQTYLYKGGLLKTNFESQEFKRSFDTIYLVSSIINAAQHPAGNSTGSVFAEAASDPHGSASIPTSLVKDAIKLSDLFKNKSKYNGQTITVSGQCVKVNNGIMGRNWVHIQDGSKANGKLLDLTVTTKMNIPPGSNIALKGKIALNKDFGAGYRYEIIMEDGDAK